ncbi:MAG: carboxymuconolactone decarboxylase family protein [Gemmatimonadota bacterium]
MPERAILGMKREALVDVSASLASREAASLERSLRIAQRFAPPESVDEILLQSHLFVGFPLALEALILWRQVEPAAAPTAAAETGEQWPDRGEEVCRTVYGRSYERLRENVARLHPDLDEWMLVGGYGRVIGRPAVDLVTRELCTVGLLTVWYAPRQLHSHLRGALNAGASDAEVSAALEVGCRYIGRERAASARELWSRVRGGSDGGGVAIEV